MSTIKGGSGNDILNGTNEADLIYGYGGNDSLYGKAGDDQLWGGSGADKLVGDTGNDILRGEFGTDQLFGGDGWDILYGGADDDKLYGEAGTDTLKGEAGNDILDAGTGTAFIYGGDGDDQLSYNPTTSNIFATGTDLNSTILNGGAGTDTLNIFNNGTSVSSEGAIEATITDVYMTGRTSAQLYFEDSFGSYIETGSFQDIEKITATGKGGLQFYGYDALGAGTDITGTASADTFVSYGANDTMRGGDGNDRFYAAGGHDTIISETDDADHFYFSPNSTYLTGQTDITGFNGAGTVDGDQLHFQTSASDNATLKITIDGDSTVFDLSTPAGSNTHVTVDAVGLVEGVDYFFS